MSRRVHTLIVLSAFLAVQVVISLPRLAFAVAPPVITVLNPVTQNLSSPVRVALDAAGSIYVADQRGGGVVRYNQFGEPVQTVKVNGVPQGIAIAQDGKLLVSQGDFVAMYDLATGLEVGRLTGGQLKSANGIAVDDVTGYIYVVDSVGNEIQVYTASGLFSSKFGARGALQGQFSLPTGIAFEKQSRQLVVADTLNNRVQFFNTGGVFVKSIGAAASRINAATTPMQFASPQAVTFEYSKDPVPVLTRMYVVDTFQGNVQAIDPAGVGTPLYIAGTSPLNNYIGSAGTATGQLTVPTDVVFDQKNSRLLVVNGFGNITIYGIDGGKNPVYADVIPPAFTINQVPVVVTVNTLTIGGTVESGSEILIAAGSASVSPVVYSGSTWNVEVSALVGGNNNFTITAKDVAGNVSAPQIVTVSYLIPAPAVAIAPISSVTKYSAITITGTVDDGALVVVTNQATSASGNALVVGTKWSYDVALVDGTNSLSIVAQKASSAKSFATAVVILDAVAPTLTVSALPNGSYTSTPVQNISGTVTDQNGASVTVNGTPVALAGNAFSFPVTLMNGSNQISIVAEDAAGNTSVVNRTINFDATKPVIAIQAPVDNSFVSKTVLAINGSVDKSSTITVAGIPAAVEGNNWSASVELLAGINTIEIIATDLYGNSSSVKRTITLDDVKPVLAVTSPVQDIAVNVPNIRISGMVSDSTALTVEYTTGGTVVTVPVSGGAFSFNVDFAAEGNNPVTITAKDAAGNTSTAVRTVIYDVTPPAFSLNQVNGVMPERLAGTVEAGSSVVIKDGEAQIGSVIIADGSWNADLTGVTYNPENLLAVATDAAGNSTSKNLAYRFPDGSLNGGNPTVQDALRAIRLVVNQLVPSALELAHYDIGPLVNGKPNPNGKIEIVDAILILRKALGLKSW